MFVARHCPSRTLVVVKQTNVDVQNAEQLEDLKVCACFEVRTKSNVVDAYVDWLLDKHNYM